MSGREEVPDGQSERELMDFGRRVAELQDSSPEARFNRERGRERLLVADLSPVSEAGSSARKVSKPVLWAAALAAAALVPLAVALTLPRHPLQFEIGLTQPGNVGEWIAAESAEARPVRFSDGSEFLLLPGGRARVTAVDASGAEVALEEGAVEVSVVHRARARWLFRIGPFQVHVVGTRFELTWDAVSEKLEVAVREGAVTVSGPVVGEARPVRGNERVTISASKGTLEVTSLAFGAASISVPSPSATGGLASSSMRELEGGGEGSPSSAMAGFAVAPRAVPEDPSATPAEGSSLVRISRGGAAKPPAGPQA